MPFLFHTIIFLSYASMAAAVALMLPQNVPGFDSNMSAVAGGVVLVACALLHEAYVQLDERRHLLGEVGSLRESQHGIMEELSRARGETRGIFEALEGAGAKGRSKPDLNEVIAEVKVLEKLVEQLSKREPEPEPEQDAEQPSEPERKGAPVLRIAMDLEPKQILDKVRQGLNTGRVDLFLQPIVSLPQRRTRHYECFSRIRVADDLMIVPDQYIGLAEREGLIGAIDNMLLFRCVQLVRKCQARKRNVGFFCNISSHSLSDKPFLQDFSQFLALNTNLAGNLVFELTQAAVNRVDSEVVRTLERVAGMGFRFSLDQVTDLNMDFAALARHRVKYLKIDAGMLLSQIRGTRSDFRELKAELNRFGIDLVAEKVEDEATLVELLDYPISFGQGYLFGEPRLSREDI